MVDSVLESINYPLLIDGGLSNVLESTGCDLNHKLWSAKILESNPEAILQAHLSYLKAGAQCITTASYQASVNGFMAIGYDKSTAEFLIIKSVQLAEQAIKEFAGTTANQSIPLIAASLGPYGAFLADGSEYHGSYGVSNDTLKQFHLSRISILDKSNADILACETIPSLQEAKVLAEILNQVQKPAWISFSCKDERHLNDSSRIEDAVKLFAKHSKVFAIGVNCTHPKFISGLVKAIKPICGNKKIIVYPNSGEAYNAKTKTWLETSEPNLFAGMAEQWISLGADIIGGCCRIGPNQIKKLSENLQLKSLQ